MSKIVVFQHVPHEGLGSFAEVFQAHQAELHYRPVYREDLSRVSLGKDSGVSALIVMGGPMSANDEEALPFIREELRLIEEALAAGLSILGVCLGSQLLAKVLGSRVYPGQQKEIGWYPLYLKEATAHDPLLKELPRELAMFQWHGETFDLPRDATLLASSKLYPHQAFRYGDKAYGFQFHPEMTSAMVKEWLNEGKAELRSSGLMPTVPDIQRQSEENLGHLNRVAKKIAEGFFSLLA